MLSWRRIKYRFYTRYIEKRPFLSILFLKYFNRGLCSTLNKLEEKFYHDFKRRSLPFSKQKCYFLNIEKVPYEKDLKLQQYNITLILSK